MPDRAKRLVILVLVLVGMAVPGLAWRYQTHGRFEQETDDAALQSDQVAIAAKLSGYVRAVRVEDNQLVAAGDRLIDIDPVDYQTRLASAQADIATAEAARQAAAAHGDEARAAVTAAEAALEGARVSATLATGEVARYRPLAEAGAESAERLAQLKADAERASAEVKARAAALNQARAQLAASAAEAGQAGARRQSAEAAGQAAANDLAATRLVAPIAGRIAARAVRVGQYVQPGLRLVTIVPDGDFYVLANFKETQVGLMRPGQPAEIRADALPGVTFRGVVESITPGTGAIFSLIPPQNATGNFTKIVQRVPVRIRILAGPAARRVLVPGLSLQVTVDTSAARGDLDAIRDEASSARPADQAPR